jgi:peptidoglycan/xylan/chitin deacetylase (PgdA/CDA1 family)
MKWIGVCLVSLFFGLAALAEGADQALSKWSEEELWSSLHQQYLLGEEWMSRFDGSIRQGRTIPSMVLDPTKEGMLYARIQAIRQFREELESELESRMMLLFSVEHSGASGQRFQDWIHGRAEAFREKLGLPKKSFEFSLDPVIRFSRAYDEKSGDVLEGFFQNPSLQEYRKWRKWFRLRGSKAFGAGSLRKLLDQSALEIQKGWPRGLELEPGRFQSDLRIFPSMGQSGNITGSGFPEGSWSLTFDDGPGPLTPEVLRNLKTEGMRASFFVLTAQLERSGEFAAFSRQAFQDGHDVLSHSYQHLKMPRLTPAALKHEIEEALLGFESLLGFRPGLFRLPYGAGVSDPRVREGLIKSCQVHVFWNVDTLDWQDRDPD